MAVTVVLSEIQRDTLARLCNTFAPSIEREDDGTGFWARSASDLGIPDAVELHDVEGVGIGDASAFPSVTGTNPMGTVMALAHRTADAIAAASTAPW
jgi:hypothetical protein